MTANVETVIQTMDGWADGSSLVKVGDSWWIVSIIHAGRVRDAVAETIEELTGTPPAEPEDDTGHVEIYRAAVDEVEVTTWAPIDPGREMDGTLMPDEVKQVVERIDRTITPIDADGDPLNGLTAAAVLPHGTTFDDAIAWITATEDS